jgi:hypothetical protein
VHQLIAWLSQVFQTWKFWIVVPPWDVGVRVRLGKIAAALQPGLHFRLPFLDEITLVNTRLRLTSTPSVSMPGTSPSKVKSVAVTVGFSIKDPVMAMLAYTMPDNMISSYAQAQLNSHGQNVEAIKAALAREFDGHGIVIESVHFVENVEVRTIKLLNGGGGLWSGHSVGPMAVGQTRNY